MCAKNAVNLWKDFQNVARRPQDDKREHLRDDMTASSVLGHGGCRMLDCLRFERLERWIIVAWYIMKPRDDVPSLCYTVRKDIMVVRAFERWAWLQGFPTEHRDDTSPDPIYACGVFLRESVFPESEEIWLKIVSS